MRPLAWVKWILCGVWLLALGFSAYAKDINFEHLSVEKGLSSSSVYAITQTPDGFLWVGTQMGLNRYDGYGFRVFTFAPGDTASLSNNWVKALWSDRSGNLWVGTSNGLSRYLKETETFVSYYADSQDPHALGNNNIWCLFEDRKGVLWIGTDGGLSRYDKQHDRFDNYLFPALGANASLAVNTVAEDPHGDLWVGTWGSGVFRFDQQKGAFKPLADLIDNKAAIGQFVKVMKFDRFGKLWMGTQGNGLHLLDPDNRRYTIFKASNKDPGTISDDAFLSILEDRNGDLWFGTYAGGLNYYDRAANRFVRYQPDVLVPQSLHGPWVTSLFQDSNGLIWAGHDNGLSKFNPEGARFLHFRNNPYNPNSIPKANINAIYEDQHGLLWFGTWGAGLSSFDVNTKKFTHYRHDSSNPASLANDRVWGLCESAGSLWLVTSRGLDQFDRRNGTFRHFNDLVGNKEGVAIPFPNLSHIQADRQNRLWIGTWGEGLYIYDPNLKTTRHLIHDPDNPNSLSNNRIKHLFIDSRQNAWISTSEGGLNRLSLDGEGRPSFKHFVYDANSPWSLGSNSPLVVYEDRSGRIWVGTEGSGLSLYDPERQEFQRIRLQGITSPLNSVFGILEDKKGSLWLSTNHGVVCYSPATGTTKLFNVSDGLQGNTFLAGQCRTRSGLMLFGGHNGFNLFAPEQIRESSFVPPVVINELRLFNEVVEVDKKHRNAFPNEPPLLDKPLYLTPEIVLSYKDYILAFGFAALDFSAPDKNQYAYMLENFEDQWNYTDASQRLATYTNLPPGEYVFKVKGTNSDGVWNEQAAWVRVVVTPPFWQTWWFRFMAIVLVGLIAYVAHRIRLQVRLENLLELERIKAQETENVRKRVAMDFHDEMGNQLASITALINLINIRHSKQNYHIDDLLKKLNQHAQTLFYGTKDFIWSIDPKSDHADVILMNIKDFAEDLFEGTGIAFHFDNAAAKEHLTLPAGFSRHITLICKEIFTNIVKHAGCSNVHVRAVAAEEHLMISITDDGCGFDLSGSHKGGFGLENMRARARKVNGKITIYSGQDSVLGSGTEIILTVGIPKKGENKKKPKFALNLYFL